MNECGQQASCQGLVSTKSSKPRTVKEEMQARVDAARQRLAEVLTNQAKAEVLGMNDWPMRDVADIVGYPF